MILAEAAIKIGVDDRAVEPGLKGIADKAKSILSGAASVAGGLLIDRLLGTLMQAGPALIGMASDAAEARSKFETVFGDLVDEADAFATDLADRLNRSKADMVEFAGNLQDTFQPLGFAGDQAFALTQKVQQLSIDLASFNNLSDEDSMNSLISGLIGSHDAVRKFGVIINEASLNQELFKMGVEDGAKAASEQQKVLARLNIILNSTTAAQGDAERTAGGFANQMKGLMGVLKDAGANIFSAFLDPLAGGISMIKPLVGTMADGIVSLIAQARENIQAATSGIFDSFGGFEAVSKRAMGYLREFGAESANVFGGLWDAVSGYVSFYHSVSKSLGFGEIAGFAVTNVGKVLGLVDDLYIGVKEIVLGVVDLVSSATGAISSSLESLGIESWLGDQFGSAQVYINDFFDQLSFGLRNMSNIAKLAFSDLVIAGLEYFPQLEGPLASIAAVASGIWSGAQNALSAFINNALSQIEDMKNVFMAVAKAIGAAFSELMSGDISNAGSAFANAFSDSMRSAEKTREFQNPAEEFAKGFTEAKNATKQAIEGQGGLLSTMKNMREGIIESIAAEEEARRQASMPKREAVRPELAEGPARMGPELPKGEDFMAEATKKDKDKKEGPSFIGLAEYNKSIQQGLIRDPNEETAKNTATLVKNAEKQTALLEKAQGPAPAGKTKGAVFG